MFLVTKNCSKYGHPEFVISCGTDVPEQDVTQLVSYLDDSVCEGMVYKDGETFKIGWMLTMISALEDGRLTIVEPDMKSFPIEWTMGVTQTLLHVRFQEGAVESVMSVDKWDIPDIREGMRIGVDVDEDTVNLFLERSDHKNRDSGWFFGNTDSQLDYSDPGNFRYESLYAVALDHSHIIKYMALPSGTRVECSPWNIEIFWNGTKLKIKHRSFLAGVLRQMKRLNGSREDAE